MDVETLWRETRGIHQDAGRDRVPEGHVWDMVDYIPGILQAAVASRGGWKWQSDVFDDPTDGLIYAPFKAGGRLLAVADDEVRSVLTGAIGSTVIGTSPPTRSNPIFHRNRVIIPAASGSDPARVVTFDGSYTLADLPASALEGRYATVFKDRTILANADGEETVVAFSKPGDPTAEWDALSRIGTSLTVTGVAAQRNQILAFHEGSVERIRGTTPPDASASDPTGDMALDWLFNRAGCFDARSIAEWQDNVIFADARGVHITDGAIVRNMVSQGGINTLWRWYFEADPSRGSAVSVSAGIIRDLYIVTIRNEAGPPVTLACDIPTRRWFRLSNVGSAAYASSVGVGERLWAADQGAMRIVDLGTILERDETAEQVDADGTPVLPVLETGWQMAGKREGYRRVLDLFVNYAAAEEEAAAAEEEDVLEVSYLHSPVESHYHPLGGLRHVEDYARRKIPVNRRVLGFGLKIEQVRPTRYTNLFGMGVASYQEEGHHQ